MKTSDHIIKLQNQIKVMEAWMNGVPVSKQYKVDPPTLTWNELPKTGFITWDWDSYDYRIDPPKPIELWAVYDTHYKRIVASAHNPADLDCFQVEPADWTRKLIKLCQVEP